MDDPYQIDGTGHVGCCHDENVGKAFDGVNLSEEGVDNSNGVGGFVGGSVASRRQALHLVNLQKKRKNFKLEKILF